MRRVTALFGAAALVLWTVGLAAQAKPSFAGKWTLDPEASTMPQMGGGRAGGGGGGGGRAGGGFGGGMAQEQTITQDAATLTREYMQGQNAVKLTYKLDGSPSVNTTAAGRGGTVESTYTSKWEGDALVTKIVQQGQQGPTERTEKISIAGGTLTIETTRPNPQGGDPIVTKAVYKK